MGKTDRAADANSAGIDMNKGLSDQVLPMGGQEIGKAGG